MSKHKGRAKGRSKNISVPRNTIASLERRITEQGKVNVALLERVDTMGSMIAAERDAKLHMGVCLAAVVKHAGGKVVLTRAEFDSMNQSMDEDGKLELSTEASDDAFTISLGAEESDAEESQPGQEPGTEEQSDDRADRDSEPDDGGSEGDAAGVHVPGDVSGASGALGEGPGGSHPNDPGQDGGGPSDDSSAAVEAGAVDD